MSLGMIFVSEEQAGNGESLSSVSSSMFVFGGIFSTEVGDGQSNQIFAHGHDLFLSPWQPQKNHITATSR